MVPSVLKGGGQAGRATGKTSDGGWEGMRANREGRGVAAAPTQGRGRDGNENHDCFLKLKCQRRIAYGGREWTPNSCTFSVIPSTQLWMVGLCVSGSSGNTETEAAYREAALNHSY